MAMKKADMIPAIIAVAGAYLAWFGVHYWRSDVKYPTDPIKAVLTGKPMPDNSKTDVQDIGTVLGQLGAASAAGVGVGGAGAAALGGAASVGQSIANDAQKYQGTSYVYGGNASKVGDWDCSSFVSYVLGHDLKFPLPGGSWGAPGFPPNSHGPTTYNYMLWGTSVDLKDVQPGDLIVSVEHIAIALSGTQMISAQDEKLGVGTSSFPAGFPSGPPMYRRVTQFAPASLLDIIGAGSAAGTTTTTPPTTRTDNPKYN